MWHVKQARSSSIAKRWCRPARNSAVGKWLAGTWLWQRLHVSDVWQLAQLSRSSAANFPWMSSFHRKVCDAGFITA